MDLADWYAGGRWIGLLDLIDGLPSASRLNEAIANDPEQAKILARMPESSSEWSPRAAEFGLTEHMLREVIHELSALRQVTIAAHGGKPGEVRPFPAPKTALPAAIEAAEREWASEFIQKFGFSPGDL